MRFFVLVMLEAYCLAVLRKTGLLGRVKTTSCSAVFEGKLKDLWSMWSSAFLTARSGEEWEENEET